MREVCFRLKNTRLYMSIAVFFALTALSVWVLIHSNAPTLNINPLLVKIASIVSLLFFAAILYFCVKMSLSKRVGLIINKDGIMDSSSALALGFIRWQSIREAKVENRDGEYILLIYLKDKDIYMNDENDYIARILKANTKNYGSEAAVLLGHLKCAPSDVENAIRLVFKKKSGYEE